MDVMCAQRVHPDNYTFNAAIGACERAGEWTHALHIFGSLSRPSASGYAMVINACIDGAEPDRAWELLAEMRRWSFAPDGLTRARFLALCEGGASVPSWQEQRLLSDFSSTGEFAASAAQTELALRFATVGC